MKSNLNKHRLNNLLRGIQKSIAHFESQGHNNVYFSALFYRGGKKQNGIDRGDVLFFAKQIRTYVNSEEADAVHVEFFNEQSSKSIYSKALKELRTGEVAVAAIPINHPQSGLGGFMGLGEAQVAAMVDRRVAEQRRNDEFQRLNREVDDLRLKNEKLSAANHDLESKVKAKSEIEFYSGVIGAAFPGLAAMLTGTPLAQAANFLAGTTDSVEKLVPDNQTADEDAQSIAALITEFCATLNAQELGAVQLLFMAFEADRSKIQSTLTYITTIQPIQALAA